MEVHNQPREGLAGVEFAWREGGQEEADRTEGLEEKHAEQLRRRTLWLR